MMARAAARGVRIAARLVAVAAFATGIAPAWAQPAAQPATAAASAPPVEDPAALLERAAMLHQVGRSRDAIAFAEHALQISEQRYGPGDPQTVSILNALGALCHAAGEYARAVALLQRALALAEAAAGPAHALTVSIQNNLASSHQALGAYEQAQALLERALGMREQTLGADHPDTATSLNNLASLLHQRARNAQALPLLQRALAIRERTLGPEHADTAAVLNNLAAVHEALGDYRAAQSNYERALEIRANALGAQHPLVAASAHNLASLRHTQGRFEEARRLYDRALEIREAALGPEHPLTAITLNNLAELHHETANHEVALAMHRRALAVREKTLGPTHRETATSLNNLAALLEALDRPHEAMPLYERSLAIQRESLGADHPDVAVPLTNLASVHESLGDYGHAQRFYELALALRTNASGAQHPDTAVALNNLAEFLRTIGQLDRALELQQRSLAIREAALGAKHPHTAISVSNLAAIHEAAGRTAQALPLAQRALAINQQAFGPRHPNTARAMANLAGLYVSMRRNGEALNLERRALAIRERALHPHHLAVALSMNNLGTLYLRLGRRQQAQQALQRAFVIVHALKRPAPLSTVAANLGALHRDAGNPSAAVFYLKISVNAAQAIRSSARELDRDLQRSLAQVHGRPYRELARLLVAQGRLGEAEQVLRMLKEDEQFEFTRRDARADPRETRASFSSAERSLAEALERNAQELGDVHARVALLDRATQRSADEEDARDRLVDRLGLLSSQWMELVAAAERNFAMQGRAARASILAQAADASGTQRDVLARLAAASGSRPALVYVLPSDNATTFLVSTADGSYTMLGGLGEKALNERIDRLRKAIAARDGSYRVPAGELYRALIAPIEAQLVAARIDTLMFYFVGALRYLPIAALHDAQSGQHLVEKYALSLYTAAAQADLSSVSAQAWSAVGLGASKGSGELDPLPGVIQELAAVVRDAPKVSDAASEAATRGVLPGSRYLDDDFTLERLLRLLDGSRRFAVIHLATHFQLVPGSDDQSFLLLGNGEKLSLRQLRGNQAIRLGSFDLVTLSACETALGAAGAGDGREVESLGVTLQRAGAKAVLATLWKIQDTGTVALMREFYRSRGETRVATKAAALRAAQLALLQGRVSSGDAKIDLRHPYFWAPFVLMGNWS
jgi:CHAT domain-containing protein